MRFFFIIYLLTLVFLARASADSAASSVDVAKGEPSKRVADGHDKHYLRSHARSVLDGDVDSSEERTFDMKMPGTAKLKSLISSEALKKIVTNTKLRLTSDKQKATNDLFQRLKVGEVKADLFQSAPFETWAKSVTKAYKKNPEGGQAAMVFTLTDHYGDKTLAKLLAEARQKYKTMIVANQLQNAQLDNWIVQKRTSNEVFSLLNLKVQEDNLLKNPMLKTWMSYEMKLTERPNRALLLKLMERYDDAGLTKMLVAAKKDRSTRTIASAVRHAQLKNWLKEKRTADDVFKLLRLSADEGGNQLRNPVLKTWLEYATMRGRDGYQVLLTKMMAKFSDEHVAKMLAVAARDINVRIDDEKLHNALLNIWLKRK
ncbi:secreted RxLR effector peptide protein, putative [Phytophthora infestans T30-4]|uniref:RxLR effector protein n=1 Tax=Phytophthora infestans (strain T30-4) TaxID=403677 RepID=D0N3J1_PHYIT|nr:secreted RxLR effector peptide protein, putative [Phytophthora infestans T30-4]EEY68945.1 secreted RxLR effector peptide protein, putative [Phytophthora infestans T30-4]|eukprot:XP_002998799.1 secreted RxLR effector peptide protein, putative [Phytophthora infestans T30-4]